MARHQTPWTQYKDEVLAKLKDHPEVVYGIVEKQRPRPSGWVEGLCPFHKETTPSFGWNKEHLGWACLSAKCNGKGDVFSFVMNIEGCSFKEAVAAIGEKLGLERSKNLTTDSKPPIKKQIVEKYAAALSENDDLRRDLCMKRGISEETIQSRKIGWDARRKRFTMPVWDEHGEVHNIRLYSPYDPKKKMMNFTMGRHAYGSPPRLYGLDLLPDRPGERVYVVEGEWDAILLIQQGMLAVSGTHGCKIFLEEWASYFKGREVVVIYDCDQDGKEATDKAVLPAFRPLVLSGQIHNIKNVVLPLKASKDDKDITDWFVKRGFDKAALEKLVFDTEPHDYKQDKTAQRELEKIIEREEAPPVDLASFKNIDRTELIGKKVRCQVTVCGEMEQTYHAVTEFEVLYCGKKERGECNHCLKPIQIPLGSRDSVGSCQATDVQVISMLQRHYCDYGQRPHLKITKRRTVKEFFCHQRVSRITNVGAESLEDSEKAKKSKEKLYGPKNEELMERRIYYASDDHLKPGNYLATGWVLDRPHTQAATFMVENMEHQEDDYEAFKLEDNLPHLHSIKKLSMEQIVGDLTQNVTRIFERDEILLGILLSYLSPRWFRFNEEVLRGWICMAIIGDVGTGKTKTFSNLADWMDIGDVFSGLTGSRTGLAYALVDHKKKGWEAKIGRYPANSGKLLMVDEIQKIDPEQLDSITKAMDEGWMQVDRVVSKGYNAQTRLIAIGNPKATQMDNYQLGCAALKGVFPVMMIRRLDFAIMANQHDVENVSQLIQGMSDAKIQNVLSSAMMRALTHRQWKIGIDEIDFGRESTQVCFEYAIKLAKKFGSAIDIPLITKYEADKKLARTSVPYASLSGSYTDDFHKLVVQPEHVIAAYDYLDEIYSAGNMMLDEYSRQKQLREEITEDEFDTIMARFDEIEQNEAHSRNGIQPIPMFRRFLKSLWDANPDRSTKTNGAAISRSEICEIVGCESRYVSMKARVLKRFNLIDTKKHGYLKHPKFVRLFRKILRDRAGYFDAITQQEMELDETQNVMFDE